MSMFPFSMKVSTCASVSVVSVSSRDPGVQPLIKTEQPFVLPSAR